jgi:hypothetical protein
VPIVALLCALSCWSQAPSWLRWRRVPYAAGAAVMAGALALGVLWATYLIVDPQLRWTPGPKVPQIGGLTGTVVQWLPVPESFRDGMRVQLGFEGTEFGGFLLGEVYSGSRWYYLPVALLIKTPIGALLLWVAGAAAMLSIRRLRPAALYVLLPPLVMLAAALDGSRQFGVRYVIYMPVVLAVAAGCVAAVRWRPARLSVALAGPLAVSSLVTWVALSSLATYPFYLPYSNEAFGGPSKTYLVLNDSNVDWGQDMRRLSIRLAERYPDERVFLSYKGRADPAYYGVTATDPLTVPPEQVRGLLVVSATRHAAQSGELRRLIDSSTLRETVGHSIMIYYRR